MAGRSATRPILRLERNCDRMAEPSFNNWLVDVFTEAKAKGWCVRPGCTTCGSAEFQNAVALRSASLAGVPSSHLAQFTSPHDQMVRLHDILDEDRKLCYPVVVEALRGLSPREVIVSEMIDAVRILLMNLKYAYQEPALELSPDLKTALSGTWAGRQIDSMEAHSEYVRDSYLAYLKREKQEAEERVEQRRLRGIKSREATMQRRDKRQALIEKFKSMPETGRAKSLLTDWTISIDAYPIKELPIGAGLNQLTVEERSKLITLIGTRRRGWHEVKAKLGQIDRRE